MAVEHDIATLFMNVIVIYLNIRNAAFSGHKIIKESKLIKVRVLGDINFIKSLACFLLFRFLLFPGIHSPDVLYFGFHIRCCKILQIISHHFGPVLEVVLGEVIGLVLGLRE